METLEKNEIGFQVEFNNQTVDIPKEVLPKIELRARAFLLPEVDPTGGLDNLAVRAEKALGYTPLREFRKGPGTLGMALRNLGIEVFNSTEVERYKAAILNAARKAAPQMTVEWKFTLIKDYKQPIPVTAIEKALKIKKTFPDARIFICHLIVAHKDADPFLYVDNGGQGEAYFLEVWDEPGFGLEKEEVK